MRRRRKFDRDFKLSVLGELQSKSYSEVCRENSLSPSVIQRWKKEFNSNPEKAFSGNGNLWKAEAEVEKYKKLVGQLYAENEFLKKTIKHMQNLQEEEEKMRCIK